MAKIKGIELKGIKTFQGMEGVGFNANIYLDGKKVGFVMDSAYGGDYNYEYDTPEAKNEIDKRIKEYYTENPIIDEIKLYYMERSEVQVLFDKGGIDAFPKESSENMFMMQDIFFDALVNLAENEKTYKRKVKAGYTILLWAERIRTKGPVPRDATWYMATEDDVQKITNQENEKYPFNIFHIYRSIEDFIIK